MPGHVVVIQNVAVAVDCLTVDWHADCNHDNNMMLDCNHYNNMMLDCNHDNNLMSDWLIIQQYKLFTAKYPSLTKI
jgi:hypothetical protein